MFRGVVVEGKGGSEGRGGGSHLSTPTAYGGTTLLPAFEHRTLEELRDKTSMAVVLGSRDAHRE